MDDPYQWPLESQKQIKSKVEATECYSIDLVFETFLVLEEAKSQSECARKIKIWTVTHSNAHIIGGHSDFEHYSYQFDGTSIALDS